MISYKNLVKEYKTNKNEVNIKFHKGNKNNKTIDVDVEIIIDGVASEFIGDFYFTFDKKTIFNYWQDYPHNLTQEEKEIFDKDNPYWATFKE